MGLVSQVSADDRESAWRIVRHREIMERLIPLWAVLGVALVLMGVDLGGRLLWTLPMIGYVFGVMAVDHGPDYRSEEHTSETPVTNEHLVCRLLLEKKKK